jgi:hypothetical protein
MLLGYALAKPDTLALYVTLTRLSGKRIVWRRLNKLNREYGLGGKPDRAELTITFPNGSEIRVMGCKDETEADKIRGIDPAPSVVVLDEAQAFKDYVQELVEDALEPMLLETDGTMVLIGTPGKIRAGYFYEACQSATEAMRQVMNVAAPANDNAGDEDDEDEDGGPEWSVHHWTIADNPFIERVAEKLVRLRKKKRWTETHPTYQREYLGRWVTEHDALVYKYDQERNGYTQLPDLTSLEWRCVFIVDQGFVHSDALGALWFRPGKPGAWLEEISVQPKKTATELQEDARAAYETRKGRCVRFGWDEGGGGKKVAEDVRRGKPAEGKRPLPVEPVEKGPGSKLAGIEATNGALVCGALKVPSNGQAAEDAGKVTWDPKARGVKLSDKYHTDVWDICNYGLRWISSMVPLDQPAELPKPIEPGELAALESAAAARARIAKNRSKRDWVKRALGG